jgi:hypothetical protein
MRGDFAPPWLAVVQDPLTDADRRPRGPTPTSILPRPSHLASPSVVQMGPPATKSLARRSRVRVCRVRPGKERARSPSVTSEDSWNGDINSQPLSHSVPIGRELDDESIRILGHLARQHNAEASAWRKHSIESRELEDIDYGALECMTQDEAAADYDRWERAKEEKMHAFRAGGVAANDAGPNIGPALACASALGWTSPATTINAPISDY